MTKKKSEPKKKEVPKTASVLPHPWTGVQDQARAHLTRSLAGLVRRRRLQRQRQAAGWQRRQEEVEQARQELARRRRVGVRQLAAAERQRRHEAQDAEYERERQELEAQDDRRFRTNTRTYNLAVNLFNNNVFPVYPSDSDSLGDYNEDE
jgi:hypothetical protein